MLNSKKKSLRKSTPKKIVKKKPAKIAVKKSPIVIQKKKVVVQKMIEQPTLLPSNQVKSILEGIHGWQLTDDHKRIYREFILKDFDAAIELIISIAVIAQEEYHHPDIHLTQYRNLRIGITSHDLGGLSQNDLDLAQKVNELPMKLREKNGNKS